MKLWKISQDFNTDCDTYDSAIVAAETEDDAKNTGMESRDCRFYGFWDAPEHVKVQHIGEAKDGTAAGLILGSFNVDKFL